MVVPVEYESEFWSGDPNSVTLSCIMPNGLIILLPVMADASFTEIKEDLWYEAQKMPLYGMLHDMSVYIFTYVNMMSEIEMILDERRRLCEVKPVAAVLIITECKGDKTEESLNCKIGHLIGKKLTEFDALSSPEVNNFRFNMRNMVDKVATRRQNYDWLHQLTYQCPPSICSKEMDIQHISNKVFCKNDIYITTIIEGKADSSFKFQVDYRIYPDAFIEMVLAKKEKVYRNSENVKDYVLKVYGRDEYLIGKHPLINFKYIRDCISAESTPTLVPIRKDKVHMQHVSDYFTTISHKKPVSSQTLRKKGNTKSSWEITEKFQLTLTAINKLNCDTKKNSVEIGVQVGLFHGGKTLCEPLKIPEKQISDVDVNLSDTLSFDIQVCNVPRSAKLCFAIYEVPKSGKGNRTRRIREPSNRDYYLNLIAWANTTVFDFKNQVKTGAMTLYTWNIADETMMNEDLLHPLGTVVSNPDPKATSLTLVFKTYSENHTILYPPIQHILKYAESRYHDGSAKNIPHEKAEELKRYFHEVESIYEVHDQDREELWKYRYHWSETAPEVLPKLLQCFDWNNKDDVSEAIFLLETWKTLPIEKALELLDYAYADQQVRSFAVKCLKKIDSEDLLLYLLQLVQALKHELFLDCDLVKYLLERALYNQRIGHYLFWHLRSEMQVPSVSVRFGLILEAYCRGSQEHMTILAKQLESLEKLKTCSDIVRNHRDKDKAKSILLENLKESYCEETLKNLTSPLDPSYRFNRIKFDKLKIMDSKMRPLWVVFENADLNADDIYVIFKRGDDLRQDMLTLQMLRIMDKLWKQEGLDLRMNTYKCISMEYRVGMIDVVLNAETIANIQKEKGMFSATSAFRKGSLLAWLKHHNPTDSQLRKACQEFTLSCAGYCVATYVLGVADRHSDNIMVKKNGQLFHIDFGHILGHFKEKFGFKRERVPFVLTHDFVHVISKGEKKTSLEFKNFQNYCETAFLILRRHGQLILSLFAMMISTGLPELTSEKDLNYLRETLVLSKSEEEALKHFQSKFDEALSNSWKTSMNWATHNMSKSSRTHC